MAKSHGVVLLVCLALLHAVAMTRATTFKVGGSGDWSVPGENAMSFNQWAERNRFKIGDSLLFVYPPEKDCVLQVERDAYDACNTTAYVGKYDDGHTVFTFDRSGPFYFISGVEANCMRNESLHVVVLANRSTSTKPSISAPPSLAPSPPPSTPSSSPPPSSEATPPPSSSAEPSSAPPPASSSESPPSEPPPAPGSMEEAPAAAPSAEGSNPPPPPPSQNGASSLKAVSSLGALIGSLWLCL